MKPDDSNEKYQATLEIKGYKQHGATITSIFVITALRNLGFHQMGVKVAFLNCELDGEIYIKQLEGFIVLGQEKKLCTLVNHCMV